VTTATVVARSDFDFEIGETALPNRRRTPTASGPIEAFECRASCNDSGNWPQISRPVFAADGTFLCQRMERGA